MRAHNSILKLDRIEKKILIFWRERMGEGRGRSQNIRQWESLVLYKSGNTLCPHCKDKMPKIWNKYSQKRNIGASDPIFTFMCLWANYIFPRWVCLFCWRKYVDRSREYLYMNRSQTQECENWGWGRAIPIKGIYKRNCRCSAGALSYRRKERPSVGL